MAEIRNLTRNGETFYPLTTSSAVINESTGEGLIIDETPTAGSNNLVKSGGIEKEFMSRDRRQQVKESFMLKNKSLIKTCYDVLSDAIIGKYIGNDGTEKSSSAYFISQPIQMSRGEMIEVNVLAAATVIADYNGGNYIPLVSNTQEYADYNVYRYTASDDISIVVCGVINSFGYLRKIILGSYEKYQAANDGFVEVDMSLVENAYINISGQVVPYRSYYISQEVEVENGDIIECDIEFSGGGDGQTVLSKVSGGNYTPLVYINRGTFGGFAYLCTENMSVVLCGKKSYPPKYRIIKGGIQLDSFPDELGRMMLNAFNEKHIDNVEVDINSDYGDGYYISGADSSLVQYADYFITSPISVNTGDIVIIDGLRCSGEAILSYYYNDGSLSFEMIQKGSTDVRHYEIPITKRCEVVVCGAKMTRDGSTINVVRNYFEEVATKTDAENLQAQIDSLKMDITNPYEGLDMSRNVLSDTHEHMNDENRIRKAYERGLRVLSCSHYLPSAPRYPFSDFDYDYENYTSMQDLTLITQNCQGSIPTITVDGNVIYTDDIPQIANAEHPFVYGQREHFNILGLLWAEPGHNLANVSGETQWKREHAIVTTEILNGLLADESKWQFGSQYVFGTINHTYNMSWIKNMLDACPSIFKAMEIFNQGYSVGWNQQFKDAYDNILRQGYKIWCTAVVDWQNDWARWDYMTNAEKVEWQAKYDALSSEEKVQYGSAENYYMETGRYKFDRGANVVLVPSGYDNLSVSDKAKEVVKSYIAGRYYLVGLGHYSVNIARNASDITFRLSDICPSIRVIDGNGSVSYSNVDTVTYHARGGNKYVRLEADWNDGDFVYTNPIWID